MRLVCPNCATQYEVEDSAVPASGREVQCGSCSRTWFQAPARSNLATTAPATDVGQWHEEEAEIPDEAASSQGAIPDIETAPNKEIINEPEADILIEAGDLDGEPVSNEPAPVAAQTPAPEPEVPDADPQAGVPEGVKTAAKVATAGAVGAGVLQQAEGQEDPAPVSTPEASDPATPQTTVEGETDLSTKVEAAIKDNATASDDNLSEIAAQEIEASKVASRLAAESKAANEAALRAAEEAATQEAISKVSPVETPSEQAATETEAQTPEAAPSTEQPDLDDISAAISNAAAEHEGVELAPPSGETEPSDLSQLVEDVTADVPDGEPLDVVSDAVAGVTGDQADVDAAAGYSAEDAAAAVASVADEQASWLQEEVEEPGQSVAENLETPEVAAPEIAGNISGAGEDLSDQATASVGELGEAAASFEEDLANTAEQAADMPASDLQVPDMDVASATQAAVESSASDAAEQMSQFETSATDGTIDGINAEINEALESLETSEPAPVEPEATAPFEPVETESGGVDQTPQPSAQEVSDAIAEAAHPQETTVSPEPEPEDPMIEAVERDAEIDQSESLAAKLKARVAEAAKAQENQNVGTAGLALGASAAGIAATAATSGRAAAFPRRDTEDLASSLRPKSKEAGSIRPRLRPEATPEQPKSRFGRGFLLALVLFLLALLLYLFRDTIAAAVPALAPALESYGGFIDQIRAVLQDAVGRLVGAVKGLTGSGADG